MTVAHRHASDLRDGKHPDFANLHTYRRLAECLARDEQDKQQEWTGQMPSQSHSDCSVSAISVVSAAGGTVSNIGAREPKAPACGSAIPCARASFCSSGNSKSPDGLRTWGAA